MQKHQMSKVFPLSALFISLGMATLAGCGSSSTGGTSTSSVNSATATACAQIIGTRVPGAARTTIGTLKSIDGQSLVVTSQQGTDTTVAYSSSTRFTQETIVPATDLKDGTAVRVAVTSSGSSYTATTITVLATGATGTGTGGNRGGFPGGFGGNGTPRAGRGGNGTPGAGQNGANPCFNRGQFGGTPGANATSTTFRGLNGTVSQLSSDGTTLTVADSSGGNYTVTISATTQIVETKSVTSAALKVGQALTVNGTAKQGTVTAATIAILLTLPTRTANGRPTPTP